METRLSEHDLGAGAEGEFFSETALQPVYELNESVLQLMMEVARTRDSEPKPSLLESIGPELLALERPAQIRLAGCPVALVDAGFQDVDWWTQVARAQALPRIPLAHSPDFPRPRATRLLQTAITLAWTIARANREAAMIIFGMHPHCLPKLAGLSIPMIQRIAETHPDRLRPRWDGDSSLWNRLLRTSREPPQARLSPLTLYVLQRQLSTLAIGGPRPATGANAEPQQNRP